MHSGSSDNIPALANEFGHRSLRRDDGVSFVKDNRDFATLVRQECSDTKPHRQRNVKAIAALRRQSTIHTLAQTYRRQ